MKSNETASSHFLYARWAEIVQRCHNKNSANYANYGGRGIIVCDEWRYSFKTCVRWALVTRFKKSMQIDREDNDGNYEPGNCRWVTNGINQQNKRINSNNKSGYRGICWHKQKSKWRAYIILECKQKSCGLFDCKIEAAKARDAACIKFGIDTLLNFPMEKENNND